MDNLDKLEKDLEIISNIKEATRELNSLGTIAFYVCVAIIAITLYRMFSSPDAVGFLIYLLAVFGCLGGLYAVNKLPLFRANVSQVEDVLRELEHKRQEVESLKEELRQRDEVLRQLEVQRQTKSESPDDSKEGETQYKLGLKYYAAKEYEQAEPLLRKVAEQLELVNAQYLLGCIYNLRQDYPEALPGSL